MSNDDRAEQMKEQQETQKRNQALLAGLQQPETDTPADKSSLIDQLTSNDIEASSDELANLVTKDFPSGNLSEEEAWEFRHWLDVVLDRYRSSYPHKDSDVTGVLREVVHDDPTAGLQPKSDADIIQDETFKQAVAARLTKGRQGRLLGLTLPSVKESVLRHADDDESSGGLIGKMTGR